MSPNTRDAVTNARAKAPEDRDYLDVALISLARVVDIAKDLYVNDPDHQCALCIAIKETGL